MPIGSTTDRVRSVRFSDPLVTRQVEYAPLAMEDERVEEGGVEGRGEREMDNGEGFRLVVIVVVVSVRVAESDEQEG